MRIARINYKKQPRWGIIKKDRIYLLDNTPFDRIKISREHISTDKAKLLPPACPSKIILIGLNYKDHARELGMPTPKEPIIFLKPLTTLTPHKGKIIYPQGVKRLDYEAELALVIKKRGKNIPESKAAEYIMGYTCCNDVTARDLQKKDGQWTRAKSFDSFCPLGPWLETEIDSNNLNIRCLVNGKLKQDSCTSNFIFSVPYLVSFISRIMTLYPGDIISTGTPPGVGKMKIGDKVEVKISGIGCLENRVVTQE